MAALEELLNGRQKLAVVGLGYVGLPLLFAFSELVPVIGFDIASDKIAICKRGPDTHKPNINHSIECSGDPDRLDEATVFIIAVPTPVHADNTPDMAILMRASEMVGKHLKPGAIVCYESTVYPGATEEVCIPVLENASGLKAGVDFGVGYSPERINPGDKVHTLETIVKIVSGMDKKTTDTLCLLYGLVAKGGIYRASSIKVAEAAKVAENSQRDINIAFVNELAMMFHSMGIDTLEVIEAMNTKWNALGFKPGLVGGHCIGVDPFYLVHKAQAQGYDSKIIAAGRSLNDSIGSFIAQQAVKLLSSVKKPLQDIRLAVLGYTFKENADDTRNTKVEDIVRELEAFGVKPLVSDPFARPKDVLHEYGRTLSDQAEVHDMDCIVLAVAHDEYKSMPIEQWEAMFVKEKPRVLVDVKGVIKPSTIEALGCAVWRL